MDAIAQAVQTPALEVQRLNEDIFRVTSHTTHRPGHPTTIVPRHLHTAQTRPRMLTRIHHSRIRRGNIRIRQGSHIRRSPTHQDNLIHHHSLIRTADIPCPRTLTQISIHRIRGIHGMIGDTPTGIHIGITTDGIITMVNMAITMRIRMLICTTMMLSRTFLHEHNKLSSQTPGPSASITVMLPQTAPANAPCKCLMHGCWLLLIVQIAFTALLTSFLRAWFAAENS